MKHETEAVKLTSIQDKYTQMMNDLTDEERASVDRISAEMDAADRHHAMTLAAVRLAAHKTQTDVAKSLSVTQGAVARTEGREDMLLSTLRSYLEAVGADMTIRVTLATGETCDLSLADLSDKTAS